MKYQTYGMKWYGSGMNWYGSDWFGVEMTQYSVYKHPICKFDIVLFLRRYEWLDLYQIGNRTVSHIAVGISVKICHKCLYFVMCQTVTLLLL